MNTSNIKIGSILSGQCLFVNGDLEVINKDDKRKIFICKRKRYGKIEVPYSYVKTNNIIKI